MNFLDSDDSKYENAVEVYNIMHPKKELTKDSDLDIYELSLKINDLAREIKSLCDAYESELCFYEVNRISFIIFNDEMSQDIQKYVNGIAKKHKDKEEARLLVELKNLSEMLRSKITEQPMIVKYEDIKEMIEESHCCKCINRDGEHCPCDFIPDEEGNYTLTSYCDESDVQDYMRSKYE